MGPKSQPAWFEEPMRSRLVISFVDNVTRGVIELALGIGGVGVRSHAWKSQPVPQL
jgi:hypothetical protein